MLAVLAALFGQNAARLAPVRAEPAAPPSFAGSGLLLSEIERALRTSVPRAVRPVGTTSVVFHMALTGEIHAAYKPQTQAHPRGHLSEVAAYRIGRALGLDHVAPAVPRDVPLDRLRTLLNPGFASGWEALSAQFVVSPNHVVRGAAIYWIPELRELGIDTPEGMQNWHRWLAQDNASGPSREKSKLTAAQISTMVAFDTVIGNWDRFSGGNAQGDRTGRQLFLRDHNVAFVEPLRPTQLTRLLGHLRHVERWSRSFVRHLRAFDAPRLRTALRAPDDPAGFVALTEIQIAGVLDRRRTVLSYVAALIDRYGESNVLTFP